MGRIAYLKQIKVSLFLTCCGTVCEAKSQADLAIIPIEATQSKHPNQKQALKRKQRGSFRELHLLTILQFFIVNSVLKPTKIFMLSEIVANTPCHLKKAVRT